MSAKIFDGTALSQRILQSLRERIRKQGLHPKLGIILAGDNPASLLYIRKKQEAAAGIGVETSLVHLPEYTDSDSLKHEIQKLNRDDSVHGIIVQFPLPKHIPEETVLQTIVPKKDVDGITPNSPFTPATAKAVELIIEEERIPVSGKYAVIIGRSRLVGLPIAHLLLKKDATVTICHKRTHDLPAFTKNADIVVSAVGKPNLIHASMVKEGVVVFNIGIAYEDTKPVGDISPDVIEKASFYTPAPGGIGPLTVAMLFVNLLNATN